MAVILAPEQRPVAGIQHRVALTDASIAVREATGSGGATDDGAIRTTTEPNDTAEDQCEPASEREGKKEGGKKKRTRESPAPRAVRCSSMPSP